MRFLLGTAEAARWPFERAGWAFERGVLWPLREGAAGWSPSGRSAGAAALGTIVAATVLAGLLLLPGSETASERVAAPAKLAVAAPDPPAQAERPSGPVLRGTSPNFAIGAGASVAETGSAAGAELNAGSAAEAPAASSAAAQPEPDGAATTSSTKPVPAGPAAMKVARRFSEAFVFYEVGERPQRAKAVFGETASAPLAEALGERPPRQPADAEVPKARVLNLVPGPRAGKAYTVSVSLLRVGLTSELRLELNRTNGQWVVTDVRG